MPALILLRDTPITAAEAARLPTGCYPVESAAHDIIAMAQLQGPTSMLVKLAVALARAIPDAQFAYEENVPSTVIEPAQVPHKDDDIIDIALDSDAAPLSSLSYAETAASSATQSSADAPPTGLFQDALSRGDVTAALEIFSAHEALQSDVVLVNRFLLSQDATHLLFLCEATNKFEWKSLAFKLRIHLGHPDPRVRIAILNTLARLAGPSLSPSVQGLLSDPDEDVKAAAERAHEILKSKLTKRA